MDTKQSLANVITEAIEACYPGVDGLPDASAIADMLEIPPQKEMGDYAFPCFKLSRALHMGPPQIAAKLAEAIDAGDLCQLDAINVKPRCDCHSGKCDESECGSYRAK